MSFWLTMFQHQSHYQCLFPSTNIVRFSPTPPPIISGSLQKNLDKIIALSRIIFLGDRKM